MRTCDARLRTAVRDGTDANLRRAVLEDSRRHATLTAERETHAVSVEHERRRHSKGSFFFETAFARGRSISSLQPPSTLTKLAAPLVGRLEDHAPANAPDENFTLIIGKPAGLW